MTRRILILTPQLPYPPEQGTSLRNFHIIKGLAQNNEITLLSLIEEGQSAEPIVIEPLLSACRRVEGVPVPLRTTGDRLRQLLTSGEPDMAHRLRSDELVGRLAWILQRGTFDVVQVEGIELAYLIPLIRRHAPGAKIVFDDHNAEAELQRRNFATDVRRWRRWPAAAYSLIQTRRLRRYERWACQEADGVTAVSEEDAALLEALSGRPVTVIPNCIDVRAYRQPRRVPPFDYDLVITGKMDYRPNVDAVLWFGQEIWPLILHSRPSTTWAIVGKNPHPRLQPLHRLPGVIVTGRVEQIRPYLDGGRVYIMPFRIGSGTRLKLIEAMAAGKAIVTTTVGAEGFPVQHDEEVLLADTPTAFARAVLQLLHRHSERDRLGQSAARFAEQYDWRMVVPRFEQVYRDVNKS